jgi:DNA-binding NarL/FixJ family response regulator
VCFPQGTKETEAIAMTSEPGVPKRMARSRKDAPGRTLPKRVLGPCRTALREFRDVEGEDDQYLCGNLPVSKLFSCKISDKDYPAARGSCGREVLPQALSAAAPIVFEPRATLATQGQHVSMAIALQVVSSHRLGVIEIESVLSVQNTLIERLLPHASSEAEALKHPNRPRLFLLDGCSMPFPLGPLSSRLRANSPGSKFLVLLAPERSAEDEMIRLFHWGIDGMLVLDEDWKSELPKAIVALLDNRLWVPSGVLLAFVKQMRILLERQLLPGQLLTGRQGQVLQLLFRRLTNKEIASEMNISERTAKFHVCNVLNKLGLENRKSLETFGLEIV